MKNISISAKLIILLSIVAAVWVSMTAYASWSTSSLSAKYTAVVSGPDAAVASLARANRALNSARAGIGELLMSRDEAGNKQASSEIATSRESFIKFFDIAIQAMPSEERLPLLKAKGLDIVDQSCRSAIEAGKAATKVDDVMASQTVYLEKCGPEFPAFTAQMTEMVNTLSDHAAKQVSEANGDASTSILTVIVVSVASLASFLVLALWGARKWLVSPLRQLSSTMAQLANGDFSANVDDTDRKDEIGSMARNVLVFKDNGQNAVRLDREAAQHRQQTEESRLAAAELDRRRASEMAQATQGLAEGLKHLAAGDLSFRLDAKFAADFEGLRSDFNATVRQLANAIESVANSTTTIDGGSQEISRSADDLSKRTEQQAAALEETAAALDEITANVHNASMRADEARIVAGDAQRSAQKSTEVVANAVSAIGKIESSSQQISNIIGVIDEIAFQTNLLALNAGVEAARAGEAGKGFAVVAQEVRELAQRSAQAAKEIKDLIRTSVAEVDSGAKLVRETGQALTTIQGFVANINQLIETIALSAKEQSAGLTQVNTAVNEMDQVTQKNAAMVEEVNAAGVALATEGSTLRTLVSGFTLPGQRYTPSVVHRPEPVKAAANPVAQLRSVAARMSGSNTALAASWEEF